MPKKGPSLFIAGEIYPPDIGGPATYTKTIAEGFAGLGYEIHVIAYGETKNQNLKIQMSNEIPNPKSQITSEFQGTKFKTIFVSRNLPKGVRHFVYFLKLLWGARKADIIFAQGPVSAGVPSFLTARILRIPFVVKIVGDYAWEEAQRKGLNIPLEAFQTANVKGKTRILRFIEKFVARRVDAVIVPSEYLRGIALKWGVKENRTCVIYNGIAEPQPIEGPDILSKLPGGKLLITVGRFVPWKRIDKIIEYFPKILEEDQLFQLIIIGSGPEEMRLKKAARSSTARDHIHFLGPLPRQQVFQMFKHAWASLLYSTYEGFSHLLLDAMLAGAPVLATDVGGNKELITNRKNGLLMPPEKPQALVDAVRELEGDPRLRELIKKEGYMTAQKFSQTRMIEETHQALLKLIHTN